MARFDATVASPARMYGVWLGGRDNFASDRELAAELTGRVPSLPLQARTNREFLCRAVGHLAGDVGIDQFLDIGAGLPTGKNVHQVARGMRLGARVVYVDRDPMVISHSRAVCEGPGIEVLEGDLRDVREIVGRCHAGRFLDFDQPIAVLLVAVLHFLDDDQAYRAVQTLVDAVAPGSFLVISHAEARPEWRDAVELYRRRVAPLTPRDHAGVTRFFDGLEIGRPGRVVPVHRWRSGPGRPPKQYGFLGGVARKSGRPSGCTT